jgi:hypothetical protein
VSPISAPVVFRPVLKGQRMQAVPLSAFSAAQVLDQPLKLLLRKCCLSRYVLQLFPADQQPFGDGDLTLHRIRRRHLMGQEHS